MKIVHMLGIAGVDSHEHPDARKWGKRLELPMLFMALWFRTARLDRIERQLEKRQPAKDSSS